MHDSYQTFQKKTSTALINMQSTKYILNNARKQKNLRVFAQNLFRHVNRVAVEKGNRKTISSLPTRNVLFFLFFIGKKWFFFYAGRENEKNLFPSHAGCGIPYLFPSPRGHPAGQSYRNDINI